MLCPQRLTVRAPCHHSQRARVKVCSTFGEPNGTASFADGAKVKVIKPIKVYHVPKMPEINLEGMEGQVSKNVGNYKGKVLSPNLPYLVKFDTKVGEANVKFSAHLADDEIEAL